MQELFSSKSSVQSWINLVPTPRKRKALNDENIAEQVRRKRHRAPLKDVNINSAAHRDVTPRKGMSASSSKHGKAGHGASGPKTPRRSGRKTPTEQVISPRQEDIEERELDLEPTPRGLSLSERTLPSSSVSSTRSRSPVKMAGLKNIQGGLEYTIIQSNAILDVESHPLYSSRAVIEALDEISQGIAVIPRSDRELMQELKHRRDFFPHHFDDSGKRDYLGASPDISRVEELVARTIECEQAQESEEGWNCDVQWPIARLALELSLHANRLKLKNITRARIQPSTLAPARTGGSKLDTRMVDFAYVLAPNEATEAGYKNLDVEDTAPLKSFNQSCFHTIADKPLAVSIETKASHVAGDDGLPQLSIWLHAHFAKLRQLTLATRPRTAELIALPPLWLSIAHGGNWRFLAATQDTLGRSTLWQYPREMATNTKIGGFQVVRALQVLLDWAEKEYRPWFEGEALPLTPEQRRRYGLFRI